MPVPSYRVPVRVARGTLAALTAGLSDLQEGELCYATDSNTLYAIEGGVLTATTADLTGVEIVNDATPQLGGELDTNNFQIISTAAGNVQIAPDTVGVLEIRGNAGNDAAIQLNCETNGHGVKIQSPPHSAAATYTLVLPSDTGTSGQALTTDGTGGLSWAASSAVGSIDDLIDVDTTTVVPANNQVLAWDGTNWVPADQTGGGGGGNVGGAVDSVNGETGVVSLGVQDMDDFALKLAGGPRYTFSSSGALEPAQGVFTNYSANTGLLIVNPVDADGIDWGSYFLDPASFYVGLAFTVKINGVELPGLSISSLGNNNSIRILFGVDPNDWYSTLEDGDEAEFLFSTFSTATVPLFQGDILQWNDGAQKFNPTSNPFITKAQLKEVTAVSVDFSDFQQRIAAL